MDNIVYFLLLFLRDATMYRCFNIQCSKTHIMKTFFH